jgi:hypothetical protein
MISTPLSPTSEALRTQWRFNANNLQVKHVHIVSTIPGKLEGEGGD